MQTYAKTRHYAVQIILLWLTNNAIITTSVIDVLCHNITRIIFILTKKNLFEFIVVKF